MQQKNEDVVFKLQITENKSDIHIGSVLGQTQAQQIAPVLWKTFPYAAGANSR